MIKIRALGPRDLEQVLVLLHRFGTQAYATLQRFKQLTLPFLKLNRCLPAKHQFLPVIYVACDDNRVLGLVVLAPDGAQNRRWRMEELIVDPDESTFDIGTQLISYVMNRYGADGVQTFIAHVTECDADGLALLKTNGFRYCTKLHWLTMPADRFVQWEQQELDITNWHLSYGDDPKPKRVLKMREASGCDAKQVSQLYNDTLPPDVRISLEKTPSDFSLEWSARYWVDRCRGQFFRRWVLEDTSLHVIIAAVELHSTNLTDFHLTVMVSPVWAAYTDKVQRFGISMVHRISRHCGLTLTVAMAQQNGFESHDLVDILVKDYWIPLKPEVPKLTSPVLLRHISPA
jgi:GNAT superfamily N-acetyltransferase